MTFNRKSVKAEVTKGVPVPIDGNRISKYKNLADEMIQAGEGSSCLLSQKEAKGLEGYLRMKRNRKTISRIVDNGLVRIWLKPEVVKRSEEKI